MMAEFQGISFIATAALAGWEGVRRFLNPSPVQGSLVVIASVVGALASLVLLIVLRRADHSMTEEAGLRHEIQDLAGFGATFLAGGMIWITNWSRWDGLASIVVASVMVNHAYVTLKQSGRILLEASPNDIDLNEIRSFIESSEVKPRVINLHVWSINSSINSMTVHIAVAEGTDCHLLQRQLDEHCRAHYSISHTTIQTSHS